jgi:hypothetical protein
VIVNLALRKDFVRGNDLFLRSKNFLGDLDSEAINNSLPIGNELVRKSCSFGNSACFTRWANRKEITQAMGGVVPDFLSVIPVEGGVGKSGHHSLGLVVIPQEIVVESLGHVDTKVISNINLIGGTGSNVFGNNIVGLFGSIVESSSSKSILRFHLQVRFVKTFSRDNSEKCGSND